MFCTTCDRRLERCICDDIDERIEQLSQSPYLAIDWAMLKYKRKQNAAEIQREREEAKAL